MNPRQGQRELFRHWLPSQGVDPAPLAELNAECLELLALRAGETAGPGLPPLLSELRGLWSDLSTQAVRRLAGAPFSLFDAGFAVSPRWLEMRAPGVHDRAQPEPGYFD